MMGKTKSVRKTEPKQVKLKPKRDRRDIKQKFFREEVREVLGKFEWGEIGIKEAVNRIVRIEKKYFKRPEPPEPPIEEEETKEIVPKENPLDKKTEEELREDYKDLKEAELSLDIEEGIKGAKGIKK